MKRHSALFALFALVASIASSPALSDEYSEPGGYLFLGGLTGFQNFPSGAVDPKTSFGFDIRAGARMMDYLALEVQGNFLSGFDFDVPTDIGSAELTLKGGNISANVRAVLPLGRFQPYATVGVGGMWASIETRNITGTTCGPSYYGWWCQGTKTRLGNSGAFVSKFGGGLDFWLTPDLAIVVDAVYVLPTGDLKDMQYLSLGWGAKFKF